MLNNMLAHRRMTLSDSVFSAESNGVGIKTMRAKLTELWANLYFELRFFSYFLVFANHQ